jgi:hypothetical protein
MSGRTAAPPPVMKAPRGSSTPPIRRATACSDFRKRANLRLGVVGFRQDESAAFTIAGGDNQVYRSAVQLSQWAQETISSAYARGDTALLQNRLKVTAGVRAEQTNINAYGPLNDPTRNFQRNASGAIIDGNPNQAGVQPVPIVPTTDLLGVARQTFIDRGRMRRRNICAGSRA